MSKTFEGESLWVKVAAPKELMRLIVPKGYIAVDGTSLTVCEVNYVEGWFNFMLVAFTQSKIIVPGKVVGDKVNLEADVLGKYVENAVGALSAKVQALEDRLSALESARS